MLCGRNKCGDILREDEGQKRVKQENLKVRIVKGEEDSRA